MWLSSAKVLTSPCQPRMRPRQINGNLNGWVSCDAYSVGRVGVDVAVLEVDDRAVINVHASALPKREALALGSVVERGSGGGMLWRRAVVVCCV